MEPVFLFLLVPVMQSLGINYLLSLESKCPFTGEVSNFLTLTV